MNNQQMPSASVLDRSAPKSGPPTPHELVARAAALRAQLWEDADETDRSRRLTPRNIAALVDAGLLRLTVPRRLGGYETDVRTLIDVTTELGRGCGSTAWVAGILNAGAWIVGLFPERAQRDVWEHDPRNCVAGVLAPSARIRRVPGGIVVTGEWGWASGCLHSQWTIAGVPLAEKPDDPPETGLILLPMNELTIKDTWFVAGMRGTGSNTLVANEVFVPSYRIISLPRALDGASWSEHKDNEPLYRSGFAAVLMLAIAGSQIGLAEAALSYVIEKAPNRPIASTRYTKQTDSVAVQLAVAEAAAKIDTARLHAMRAASDADATGARGKMPDMLIRTRIRMDNAWASQQCREAVQLLMTAYGTSAFAEASPLQRIWRDLGTASHHAIAAPNVCKEVYGKALLGVEPQISTLF
jgi:3-hydroxy-9,10-secoandrosta-1,3,5(10)-triene-9,17-dione monooxygenase